MERCSRIPTALPQRVRDDIAPKVAADPAYEKIRSVLRFEAAEAFGSTLVLQLLQHGDDVTRLVIRASKNGYVDPREWEMAIAPPDGTRLIAELAAIHIGADPRRRGLTNTRQATPRSTIGPYWRPT